MSIIIQYNIYIEANAFIREVTVYIRLSSTINNRAPNRISDRHVC